MNSLTISIEDKYYTEISFKIPNMYISIDIGVRFGVLLSILFYGGDTGKIKGNA